MATTPGHPLAAGQMQQQQQRGPVAAAAGQMMPTTAGSPGSGVQVMLSPGTGAKPL
jgi:hypothetical protein